MSLVFPSYAFDEVVAAICHGTFDEAQARALNELLKADPAARDEYILRVELHTRLASDQDLFAPAAHGAGETGAAGREPGLAAPAVPVNAPAPAGRQKTAWALALAASLAVVLAGWWGLGEWRESGRRGATSNAVAMLNRVVDARWGGPGDPPRLGAPLEPGWLHLTSGLAQVVFYSGVRVVVEGPAEFQIISPGEASCRAGRLTAEVPPQASGFKIETPQMKVTDLGTVFGLEVKDRQTELHVFKGEVEFQPASGSAARQVREGSGAVAEASRAPRLIAANTAGFASLFDLQARSAAADSHRLSEWRAASSGLNNDPSLLVHFDFERAAAKDWQLRNVSSRREEMPDGVIVGGEWVEGRWPVKTALEFQSVNDRVRLSLPGSHESLTLAAWVRVQGLDRQFSSLFMSEGFEAGTLHWLIRKDGVLGLTVVGHEPGKFQIVASPPVLSLGQFGQWLHLAVVLDGGSRRVEHYLNGRPVGGKPLKISPPFRVGAAELGNWNARGFPGNDPSLIRNFSGAMDDFCLFGRALGHREILELYSAGKPQPNSNTSQSKP